VGRSLRHLPRAAQGPRRLSGALSVAAFAALAAPSCLVTTTSDFQDPTQLTPPFLSAATAEPPIDSFVLIDDINVTRFFNATLRSQDYPDSPLFARLYLDFPANTQGNLLDQAPVETKNLDDSPRRISLTWRPSTAGSAVVTPGCHSITLMVSRNFQAIDVRPAGGETETDFLVWWVYLPADVLARGQGVAGAGGSAGAGGGEAGTGGAAGAGGQAGVDGAAGAGPSGDFDSIERCLLLGSRP
jgi:hypothetical protein